LEYLNRFILGLCHPGPGGGDAQAFQNGFALMLHQVGSSFGQCPINNFLLCHFDPEIAYSQDCFLKKLARSDALISDKGQTILHG
jgi:hypothetical protein